MPQEEINRLEILITKLGEQLSNITAMVQSVKDCQEKERDKASANAERITVLEQNMITAKKDIDDNFKQHQTFYDVQDKMERIEGMGVVVKIIVGFIVSITVGLVVTAIKVFLG